MEYSGSMQWAALTGKTNLFHILVFSCITPGKGCTVAGLCCQSWQMSFKSFTFLIIILVTYFSLKSDILLECLLSCLYTLNSKHFFQMQFILRLLFYFYNWYMNFTLYIIWTLYELHIIRKIRTFLNHLPWWHHSLCCCQMHSHNFSQFQKFISLQIMRSGCGCHLLVQKTTFLWNCQFSHHIFPSRHKKNVL